MASVLIKIWDSVILLGVIIGLVWVWRHWRLVERKILENNALPREAPLGNVLVLIIVVIAGIIGVHLYLLF